MPEISVIVPVYNVGACLDECMETLTQQTFGDMEILLLNDGSTDDSPERCRAWAQRDERIRLIDKPNEGVAATRNRGVLEARGKYIAFVDPDDWLDLTYMEKLYRRLEETGAAFAECDLWRCHDRTGEKIYRHCSGRTGKEYTLREHMKYAPTASYKSLFRRSLWTENGVRMPSCAFESPAVYSLLVALSGSVESVHEALYYYRRFRKGSLIETGYALPNGAPNHTLGIEAMNFLMEEFRRCGLYEQYRDTLEGVVKYRLNDILAMQFHRRSPEDHAALTGNIRAFLSQAFPHGHNEVYFTWGGYNLNRVLTHMNWLHDPAGRFNFSSIVSVCSPETSVLPPLRGKNRYRQIMLEREASRVFWQALSEQRPEYLFIDLTEERFNLTQIGESYVTRSDSFLREDEIILNAFPKLERESGEGDRLWKKSAETFVRRVRESVPQIRIVILEDLLTETVGDIHAQAPFPERDAIRRTNARLRRYYEYLESLCPEATVVRPWESPLFFTDKDYEYGAIPSHYNELLNQTLAEKLETILPVKRQGGAV